MDADFGIEEEPFFHSNFFKDWWEGAYKIGRIKLCRVYESVLYSRTNGQFLHGNKIGQTLKFLYTTYLMGKNLVKKFEEKKMFYKLFGSKQNSVLNGRDI